MEINQHTVEPMGQRRNQKGNLKISWDKQKRNIPKLMGWSRSWTINQQGSLQCKKKKKKPFDFFEMLSMVTYIQSKKELQEKFWELTSAFNKQGKGQFYPKLVSWPCRKEVQSYEPPS